MSFISYNIKHVAIALGSGCYVLFARVMTKGRRGGPC